MRVRIKHALLLGWLICATAAAQSSAVAGDPHPVNIALMYSGLRGNGTGTGSFWMNGGAFQVDGQVWRALGIAGDLTGEHAGNINSTGPGLNLITVSAGPRVTVRRHAAAIYGQTLFGAARGFDGLFPSVGGTETKAGSLALQAGGGMTLDFRGRIGVRVFEVDWLRTQLPNSTTGIQNNLRIAAGVVFRIR